MTTLVNQNVFVTGANRGIGSEFVSQLLERGVAKVYAGARRPETVQAPDSRVVPIRLDVTDRESVERAVAAAGDVSILINNAGISLAGSVLSDEPSLRSELEVNLHGPLAVTNAFLDGIVKRGGAIVNVASVLSWLSLGGSYSVSKAALWSATDAMRLELGPKGVQVVGVHMAYVDTDMTAGVNAPKSSPEDIVRQVLDGIESGAAEILADDLTRQVRAGLNLPATERYAAFIAS